MKPSRTFPLQLSMRPLTAVATRGPFRTGQIALLAVGLVLAGLVLVVVVVFQLFSNPSSDYGCSLPGQHALANREEFIRSHVSGATDFSVATYDCEDGSTAHLDFTTALTPQAVRTALLSGGACGPFEKADDDATYLICGTGSRASTIFLGEANDGTTLGEVYLDR